MFVWVNLYPIVPFYGLRYQRIRYEIHLLFSLLLLFLLWCLLICREWCAKTVLTEYLYSCVGTIFHLWYYFGQNVTLLAPCPSNLRDMFKCVEHSSPRPQKWVHRPRSQKRTFMMCHFPTDIQRTVVSRLIWTQTNFTSRVCFCSSVDDSNVSSKNYPLKTDLMEELL